MITEMFPFTPQSVGHGPIRIAVGKKSGRESLLYKVKKQGLKLEEKNLDDVLQKVKKLAVTKKRVLTDEEIAEIVDKSNRQD
jgi:isopropylmalate/homocitrate/citramalate synthase